MADERTSIPPIPESRAVARKRTRISVVWVIPIIAAVGAWVAISRIESEGPKIEIIFGSAEGLEAGKTRIEYKGVEVGTITAIRLTEDHQRVIATAQMTPGPNSSWSRTRSSGWCGPESPGPMCRGWAP